MSAFSLLACVLCVLCAQGMGGLCSAPEASDSDMCVLKRASKDACGGIMSTATISITIVASFPRYASCTNSHLCRQIQRGGPRNNCDFVRWNSRVAVSPVTPVGSLQLGGREFRCVFNIMFHVSSSFSAAYHL